MELSFSESVLSIIAGKNGKKTMEIFSLSLFFAHDDIRIWMFLPVIPNRIELKTAIRTLNHHGFVSYSEENYSYIVCNEAGLRHRDELNRYELEQKALRRTLEFLKTAKPSYHSHFVSVYLHAKQYPDLFKDLDDLPGNMLKGMIDSKKDTVAVQLCKEWIEFMTNILGECHWTVLHLRSRFGLALLEGGSRDSAVKMLVDVYQKTRNALGDVEIRDIMAILAEVILRVDPTNKQAAEDRLRQVVFGGKNVSDCKDNSELEVWIYYANLLGRFGLISGGVLILKDIIKCRRRLFGPRDDGINDVMQAEAQLLTSDSRYAEALKLLQTVDQRRKKNLGVLNPKTLENLNVKGSILILQGKLKEALALFEQVVTRAKMTVGEDHQLVLNAKTSMVKILLLQRNFHRALELCSGVEEKLSTAYGVVHPQWLTIRKFMAVILLQKGKRHKALRIWKDLLDDLENSYEQEEELKSIRNITEVIESTLFVSKPISLHSKVKKGYLNEVIRISNEAPWLLDSRDALDHTPLHYASAYERVQEARVLLGKGANYNCVCSRNGFTPLDLAKDGDEVHALLTTVHSFFNAVKRNDCDAIVELASKEPCVFGATVTGRHTPLLGAIILGRLEMTKALIEIGADPRAGATCFYYRTPMFTAASFGHVEIAEMLLEVLGSEGLGLQNDPLSTPLHAAAEGGHLNMTKFLLARGAVYSTRDYKEETARQVAASREVKDLLRFVEGLFEDTRKGKVEWVVARLRAMEEGEKEAVAGAKNDQQKTLLQLAMTVGNVQLVRNLVKGLSTIRRSKGLAST